MYTEKILNCVVLTRTTFYSVTLYVIQKFNTLLLHEYFPS